MKRIVLLGILLAVPASLFAQEAFTKGASTAARSATAKYANANSVSFKAGVASPAIAMAQAQVSYSLCAAVGADPKCPKSAEISGVARLSIRGADGKTVSSSEVAFRQASTAEQGRETIAGTIPVSLSVLAPALMPGTYTADLEIRSNAASQAFSVTPGAVNVVVLKSRLH